MANEPTNEQRLAARERLEKRQARHGYAPSQQANRDFSFFSNGLSEQNEQDSTPQYEQDVAGGATDNSKQPAQESNPKDSWEEIPRTYNKRPEGVKPRTGGSRPVKIHGQNDIMKPSQGHTTVTIPLITQNHVGSNQLSFSGKGHNWKPIILGAIIVLILLFIVFVVSSCGK